MTIRLSVTVNNAETMMETRYEAEVECDRGTTLEQAEASMVNILRALDQQATETQDDDEDG